MAWDVEYTDEFEVWWSELGEPQQDRIAASVELLAERGPSLPFPHSSGIKESRHPHLRELRVQSGGSPLRVLYAFDPRRSAILLIGGDKTGNDRFYQQLIPMADDLYDAHIKELMAEGLL